MAETPPGGIEQPPQTLWGILRRLGPGLIIAGSIVGSGELVATTKTGAVAGFWLLWLILIGCVIKLFAQVEFGRYTISSGKATMEALDEVPGPRIKVNWILWYWLFMFVITMGQLGGIVGGVGQSLAMSLPITGDFNQLLDDQDAWDAAADDRGEEETTVQFGPRPTAATRDDVYWAAAVTAVTIVMLVSGRYRLVQNVSVFFVGSFTLVTIVNLLILQSQPDWAVSLGDLKDGLSFRLPPMVEGLTRSPLAVALATFGIIGVGANELIAYPYWCLEKGYARFAGPRDETPQWAERARGWMRVMVWDATLSMVVFTFATAAFYLLGAAVLHRNGLDPADNQMIRVLSEMYVPVFGAWAGWLFLFGAFAVLYSTFFVANAGHARVASDAVRIFGLRPHTERARLAWVRAFCVIFPLSNILCYAFIRAPDKLILASGVTQAIMLPMLGAATLYYRYRRTDRRIAPGKLWDIMLWASAIGLLVAGGWMALIKVFPGLEQLGAP